jgi:hypothetical protein
MMRPRPKLRTTPQREQRFQSKSKSPSTPCRLTTQRSGAAGLLWAIALQRLLDRAHRNPNQKDYVNQSEHQEDELEVVSN